MVEKISVFSGIADVGDLFLLNENDLWGMSNILVSFRIGEVVTFLWLVRWKRSMRKRELAIIVVAGDRLIRPLDH